MAAALGCCLIDIPKYLILMFFFRYTTDDLDAPAAFLVELMLHVLFLILFLLLYKKLNPILIIVGSAVVGIIFGYTGVITV